MTSSPMNPDERDLLDYADAVNAGEAPQPQTDLERTYLHVQSTMKGESGAIPADLKQSTWEDVMDTLSLAPERPISNRTRRHRATTPVRMIPKRLRWTPLASVALVAVLVLASIGTWRAATYDNGTTPPLAPHVAGLSTSADTALLAATPESDEAHAASRSIPIVQNVDTQPMDGPVIWLTNSGDVMYDDGLGAVETITTGVSFIKPGMPNILQFTTEGETTIGKDGNPVGSYTTTYYNLVSGESLVDDGTFSSYLGGTNMYGPLTVLTIADAPGQWSIVNFETMESRSIAELTGGAFPSQESITVSVADNHSAIAVATSQYESESSSTLMLQSGLPGEVAVIPADLSEPTWVSVPEGMPAVGNISLSPDGTRVAFISADNFRGGSNMTVAVVDVVTGEQLVRTQRVESTTFSNFQWVEDGGTFVIVTDKAVQKYALDGSDMTILFKTDGTINQMPQFGVSNILHLQVSSEDLSITTPRPETTQFVILNTETGETVTVEGKPWYLGASHPVQLSTSLAPIPVSQDGRTAVLVHPITGESDPALIADVYDPLADPNFDPETAEPVPFVQPVVTAQEASVSVVTLADGTLAVLTTTTKSMDTRAIEIPEGAAGKQLQLSPDGEYLLAGAAWESQGEGDSYYTLDLTDPNTEWVSGAPGQRISFVEIRDVQP